MAVGDTHVFPGFLTPVLTQLFFPKPPTTFLTCFCRGERRKYAGKKSRLSRGSTSQPPGHKSDTLTTEPPGRGKAAARYLGLYKPFPRRQILVSSKLNEFADDNFDFKENGRTFSKWVENTVGKGEIARYEQFLLFPQCFQKTCTADTSKPGLVWERVKGHTL